MAQRGTLYDKPDLYCPELDHFYARQVSMVFDAPSTGAKQAAAARACHDRLVRGGTEPAAYNTAENTADFAELRQALGVKEWNVYGYSYGSDLALSFMRDHPEGIRTVTIDSVGPPNIVSLPWTWSSAREGITTIFGSCEEHPRCNRHYPDLLPTFIHEVRRLEAHPLVRRVRPPQGGAPVKVVLDGGTLVKPRAQLHAHAPAGHPLGRHRRDLPAAAGGWCRRRGQRRRCRRRSRRRSIP